jgi:predicted ester cyclase
VFQATERHVGMNNSSDTRPALSTGADLIDRLLADCFQPVSPRSIDRYSDSPRVRNLYAADVEAFPDATFSPLWSVADNDRVAVGGITRATHGGTWREVPATGRRIEVLATVMFETSAGGVVDLMVVTDSLAIAEQVGAVQPLGPKACAVPDGPTRTGRTQCGDGLFS